MDEMENRVLTVVAQVTDRPVSDMSITTDLASFNLDSLDNLEILMSLEEALGVEIDVSRISRCQTLGDIAAELNQLVSSLKNTKNPRLAV